MSSLTDWINATPERRRDYEQERLTVDVAESLQGLLDKASMTRAELARRMKTSRQSLHQMLSGEQNLTLRTIALMAHELGCRASVTFEPYSAKETPPARPCVWRTGCKHQAVCDKQGVCVPGGEETPADDSPDPGRVCSGYETPANPPPVTTFKAGANGCEHCGLSFLLHIEQDEYGRKDVCQGQSTANREVGQ